MLETHQDNEKVQFSEQKKQLVLCCEDTIAQHGANNPMMVCGSCKKIIKSFSDEKAYRNYVRFCESRHRKILAMPYKDTHIVIFKNC